MTTAEILETLRAEYPDCLTADGLDDAIVGVVEGCGRQTVVCYDYEKCVRVLMKRTHMTDSEAREFLDFNTVGSYLGPFTPLFLHRWR